MTGIDYDAFRTEVQAFASTNCPDDIRRLVATNAKMTREPWARWQAILHEHGWGAPNWPIEHGGNGWDPIQLTIFDEVMAEFDCPPTYHHGLRHIGPVIIEFGTEEQQRTYLPGIMTGRDWWCQGYSEPGAGSDLASLRTRAERHDDVYVVNGQKAWTSHAHEADLMYTLVRTSTDGPKQKGISLLLIPLDSPGITIRPVRTIDGWHHVNEVFLDDVEVPVINRVGAEGQGWSYGKFLLQRERLSSAKTAPLLQFVKRTRRLVLDVLDDPQNRSRRDQLLSRLVHLEAEIAGQRELAIRAVDAVLYNKPLGLTTSSLKLASSRLFQQISEVSAEVLAPSMMSRFPVREDGHDLIDDQIVWLQNYLFLRSRTIVGGATEVQKNLIANQLFGS